jgi:glycosyltransferase involved in cell wall biosynthesis
MDFYIRIMISIITPCCRPENLSLLSLSIDFSQVDRWYVIYDTREGRKYTKQFDQNPKIIELECSEGISGNPQRNLALKLVRDGFVYFLDDDNMIHPEFWNIVKTLDPERFYTFDQLRKDHLGPVLKGNNPVSCGIDTAMYIIPRKIIGDIKWQNERYDADGVFIETIHKRFKEKHVYLEKVAAYYNFLT